MTDGEKHGMNYRIHTFLFYDGFPDVLRFQDWKQPRVTPIVKKESG
jgi:GH35 family endo-1,4-beta-xylanase